MPDLLFSEINKQAEALFALEQYEKVIELYESCRADYPENLFEMTWESALAEALDNRKEAAFTRLEEGADKHGFFYPLTKDDDLFSIEPYTERFSTLWEGNETLRQAAQSRSRPHELFIPAENPDLSEEEKNLPEGLCCALKAPQAFLALHGWGENAEFFLDRWTSSRLTRFTDRLYVQSSRIADFHNFCWDETALARREVKESAERSLLSKPSRHLMAGGFSQGAALALTLAMEKDLAIEGLILLCPPLPENWSADKLAAWSQGKRRLWIITGENDHELESQRRMIHEAKAAGVPCQLTINKGTGHWFPSNLDKQIDEAVDYCLGCFDLEE